MTIFNASARKDLALIVSTSIVGALVVNAGPIVAIILNWMN